MCHNIYFRAFWFPPSETHWTIYLQEENNQNQKGKSETVAWGDYLQLCHVSSSPSYVSLVSISIKRSQTSQVGKQKHIVCCLLSGFFAYSSSIYLNEYSRHHSEPENLPTASPNCPLKKHKYDTAFSNLYASFWAEKHLACRHRWQNLHYTLVCVFFIEFTIFSSKFPPLKLMLKAIRCLDTLKGTITLSASVWYAVTPCIP